MTNTMFEDYFSEEIWKSTYKYHEDKDVNDTFKRVAKAIAKAEKTEELRNEWEEKFYDLMSNFKFVPGGRILSNAGTDFKSTTLYNCYLNVKVDEDIDSIEGIYKSLLYQAQTLKSEGGIGINCSYIRPRGSYINGVGVDSPGSIRFMELFDKSSEVITAGSGLESSNNKGKPRHRTGAQMLILEVWHNDIIEFINAKRQPGRLTKFNMSVGLTKDFMDKVVKIEEIREKQKDLDVHSKEYKALQNKLDDINYWELVFPDTTFEKYKQEWDGDINKWKNKDYPINILTKTTVTKIWDMILRSTYTRNEPGLFFIDRANEKFPGNYIDNLRIVGTNPCGEIPMESGSACLLGSLNITQFIKGSDIDYEKLSESVRVAVRFLDNVVDVSKTPIDEYRRNMQTRRRIGLGIMGWGSALNMIGLSFNDKKSYYIQERLMQTITYTAYDESANLAKEKGMFTLCNPLKHSKSDFIKQINLPEKIKAKIKKFGIRNTTLTMVAPTGTTGIFANNVSGGIEPIFMPEYIRTVTLSHVPKDIEKLTPKWYEGEWKETELFKFTKEGDEEILKGKFNNIVYKIDKNRGLTKEVLVQDYSVKYLNNNELDTSHFKTINDLSVDDHVKSLSIFAKYLCNSASKTVNLPNDYPFHDFKKVYLDAYTSGYIKGITTYRAGTMTSVLSAKDEKDTVEEEIIHDNVQLPDSAPAKLKTIRAEGKKWYLTTIYYEGTNRPFAIFVKTNSHEKNILTNNALDLLFELAENKGIPKKHIDDVKGKIGADDNASKITRVLGLLLRHGVLIKNICAILDKTEGLTVSSFIFQIKKFLQTHIKEGEKVDGEKCTSCGSEAIVYSEGCFKCMECGHSKCG